MTRKLTWAMLITASALSLTAQADEMDLVITEVMQQTTSGTASTINGDWWELTNTGDTAINLAGFQWADTEDALPSTDSNFFPSFIINPGQSIIILEENTSNEAAWLTNWGLDSSVVILAMDEMVDDSTPDGDTFSGLSSSGDGVFFYNPLGQLISSFSYSSSIRGTSFEISKSGVSLGNSVVGEFGAVKAANNDVGSPGTAVPEPVTMSLLSLAMGGLLLRRRTH